MYTIKIHHIALVKIFMYLNKKRLIPLLDCVVLDANIIIITNTVQSLVDDISLP